MGMFLNNTAPYEGYKKISQSRYFVDKTSLISDLIDGFANDTQYLCITRPRRFGKTMAANMVAAFFGKTYASKEIFEALAVSSNPDFQSYLNHYDVIYIDFSRTSKDCHDYQEYIGRFQDGLMNDLIKEYPDMYFDEELPVWDALNRIVEKYNTRFIFVMDEWDAIFHMRAMTDTDKEKYLQFLKNLLKDQTYVELAYMTGILPIAKYSDGSELNMFSEYNMVSKVKFCEYFGFTDDEVDLLYKKYISCQKFPQISREDLGIWYDGYYVFSGKRLYNPRSVICALKDNQLSDYWVSSGRYDTIYYYIQNNIDDVREDIALMAAGEHIEANIQEYAAVSMDLVSKDNIYSAMVVYGLLTYKDGEVMIPNRELMMKFGELVRTRTELGYVNRLARESQKMLKATLSGDTKTMENILEYAHNTEIPILSYNNETELAALINLVYLAARDRYRVEREDKAGKGFADFVFYPDRTEDDSIIIELKIDDTPEHAIQQIREKDYVFAVKARWGDKQRYRGRILAVGIGYDKKTKKHACMVEELL